MFFLELHLYELLFLRVRIGVTGRCPGEDDHGFRDPPYLLPVSDQLQDDQVVSRICLGQGTCAVVVSAILFYLI